MDEHKGQPERLRLPRLLIATDAFLPRWDGIARFLSEVIPLLLDDFDITVIAPLTPEFKDYKDKEEKYKIIRVPTFNFTIGDYYPPSFSTKVIEEAVRNADIVWTHAMMPIGITAIRQATKQKKPVVATVHSIEKLLVTHSLSDRNFLRKIMAVFVPLFTSHFYNKCSLVFVHSKEIEELARLQGIDARKKIAPLGTDTEKFRPAHDKAKAKEAIGLNPAKKVIGYCGRIGREKDVMTLYRAFYRLDKRRGDVTLLIVGKGVKQTEDFLRSKANVVVTGSMDNVVPYLQAMDIYVLPSWTETTSLSTMEAMSCGIPVVVTQVGSVKEYVKHRYNGMFFRQGNNFVLSKKLEFLLDRPAEMERMGKNARKTIAEHYSWKKTVEKIKEGLIEVLDESSTQVQPKNL